MCLALSLGEPNVCKNPVCGGRHGVSIPMRAWLPADAANAVRDVLRTVAQCHARNVLIRDVKPDNFLYLTTDEDAPLKAIDFGLAQYCKPDQHLRDRAGKTPAYIACCQAALWVEYVIPSLAISNIPCFDLLRGVCVPSMVLS